MQRAQRIGVIGPHAKVWDLDTGHMLRTLEGHSFFVNGVAVTPDGRVSFLRRRTPRSGCGIPRRAGRFAL